MLFGITLLKEPLENNFIYQVCFYTGSIEWLLGLGPLSPHYDKTQCIITSYFALTIGVLVLKFLICIASLAAVYYNSLS